MKNDNKKFILEVRAMGPAVIPISYSGDDDGSSDDCLIGAEHLLSKESVRETKRCKRRCVRAVLREQTRQLMNPSDKDSEWDDRWTAISLASKAETSSSVDRARKLGKIHHHFS